MSQSAKEFLAEAGYDPKFGGRPLARAIRRHIENPLSGRLIEGDFPEGSTILVEKSDDVEGDELTFTAKEKVSS